MCLCLRCHVCVASALCWSRVVVACIRNSCCSWHVWGAFCVRWLTISTSGASYSSIGTQLKHFPVCVSIARLARFAPLFWSISNLLWKPGPSDTLASQCMTDGHSAMMGGASNIVLCGKPCLQDSQPFNNWIWAQEAMWCLSAGPVSWGTPQAGG